MPLNSCSYIMWVLNSYCSIGRGPHPRLSATTPPLTANSKATKNKRPQRERWRPPSLGLTPRFPRQSQQVQK